MEENRFKKTRLKYKKKQKFFWSPFIDKVGTINNVVNAATSLENKKKINLKFH